MPSATYALSLHATYGCRDRGACCTAGWPIPIEDDRLAVAERAMAEGRLATPRTAPVAFLRSPAAPPSSPAVVAAQGGACVFYRETGHGRCEIHRALGHAALPLACRQFPRVSVHDPRGTSITLSHFCPTVADMVTLPAEVAIVENVPAFPATAEYVGLDATETLPPLLRPDMAMDWESWWLWERLAIDTIARAESIDVMFTRLRAAVEHVRVWSPSDGALARRAEASFGRAVLSRPPEGELQETLVETVRSAIDEDLRPARPAPSPNTTPGVTRRHFLAAHAFANWTAYLGLGLRSWLRSIQAADALIGSGLSVSEADLWMRHLADPRVFAKILSRGEAE